MEDKIINYNFFHWGPFLYKTVLTKEEINLIKKLCSKNSKDYRGNLAGLLRHEHEIDNKKIFSILSPYFNSYAKAFMEYSGKPLANKIELEKCWVNFMTKFELADSKILINQHTFFPEVGDFFIFPASLHHYVNSFKCEGERISISGNLVIN